MGFVIKYRRFFSVLLNESVTGNDVEGFTFFPTEQCSRILKNYNLVFRPRPAGFEVYFSETPIISIESLIRFSFGFTIADAGIYKKYGLEKENESDTTVYQPALYFDNRNADGSIITISPASLVAAGSETDKTVTAPDTCKIYRQTFKVYDSTEGNPPSSYELSHRFDSGLTQTISVVNIPDVDVLTTTINSVDLKEDYISEPGPYLLQADTDPPPDRNVYLNDEFGSQTVHGVVDIYWEASQDTVPLESGQAYQITFKPKQS